MGHNPGTLENWISFRDVHMILLLFFEVLYWAKLAKNTKKRYVQVILRSTPYFHTGLLVPKKPTTFTSKLQNFFRLQFYINQSLYFQQAVNFKIKAKHGQDGLVFQLHERNQSTIFENELDLGKSSLFRFKKGVLG